MARMSTSGTGKKSRYFDYNSLEDSDSYVTAADAAFHTVMKKLKSFKPYLMKRLESIKCSGKHFAESETIEDIEYWLDVMNNARADIEYGMDTLNEIVHDILEHMRENPIEACYGDEEDERDAEPISRNVDVDTFKSHEQRLHDSNKKIEADEYSMDSTAETGAVPNVEEVVRNPHGPPPDPTFEERPLNSAVGSNVEHSTRRETESTAPAVITLTQGVGRGVRRVPDVPTACDRDPGETCYDSTGAPLPFAEEQLEPSGQSVYRRPYLHRNQASVLEPPDYRAAIDGDVLNCSPGMEMQPNFLGGYPPPMYAPHASMWNFQYCQPYPNMPQHTQQPFAYPMPMFGHGRRPHRGNSSRVGGNHQIPRYQPPEGDLAPCNEQDFSRTDDDAIENQDICPSSSDLRSNDLSASAVAKRAQEYFARYRKQSNFSNRGSRFPKPKPQNRGVFRKPFQRAPRNGRPLSFIPTTADGTRSDSNDTSAADIPTEYEQPMDATEGSGANKTPAPPRIGRDPTRKPEGKRLSEQEAANRFRMNQVVNDSGTSPEKVQELKRKLAKQGYHKLGSKNPDFVEAEALPADVFSNISPGKPKTPRKQTPSPSTKKRVRSRSLGPPTPGKKSATPGKSKTPKKSPEEKATCKSPRVKTPSKSPKISLNFPGVPSRRKVVRYSSDSEGTDSESPSGPSRRRTRARSLSQSADGPTQGPPPAAQMDRTIDDISDEYTRTFLLSVNYDLAQITKIMSDPLGVKGLKEIILDQERMLFADQAAVAAANNTADQMNTSGSPDCGIMKSPTSGQRLAEVDSDASSPDRTSSARNTMNSSGRTYSQRLEMEDYGPAPAVVSDAYFPPKKRKYGGNSHPGIDEPEPPKRRHISRAASVISDFSGVAGDNSDSDDDSGSVLSYASNVRAMLAAKFKSNTLPTKSPFAPMYEYVPPTVTANATLGKVKIEQDYMVVETIKTEVDLS